MAVGTNSLACGFNWQCTADAIGYAIMITVRLDSLPSPQSLPRFGSTPAERQPGQQHTGTFHKYSSSIIIIIIISAHKSDLSYPWSQTQASLSIPSLHPKNTNKRREREEKNNRRENLPRSDRRGREKIKQEQKNKSKDPPRISERQIDKQARQTKCQDHTNCRYRTRVAKHTPPVAGRGAADSQALRQGAPV